MTRKLKLNNENQQVLAHKSTLKQRNWLTDIAYLSIFILVFYTLWLGSYPFFTPDEGRYSEVAREMVAAGDYITPRVNGVAFLDKPVLYYWLQATAILLFGVKEWALRLFPVLSGLMGCLMTYLCGRLLFNRRTGLLAAAILATTPLYFGCTHYANLDLEVAVFITCSLLSFLTGTQIHRPGRTYFLIAAYIFAALAFLTKGLIAIAFPCMIAGTWILLLSKWNILKKIHLIPGLILFSIIVLPWYMQVQQANPEFLHYFFVTQQVTRFLSAAEFNNPTPSWFYLPIVMIGFFPWSTFAVQAIYRSVQRVWQDRQTYQIELFLLLWLGIIFTFFSIPRAKTISYILPVFPALALLVGNYLSLMWQAKRSTMLTYSLIFFIAAGLFASLLLSIIHFKLIELSPAFHPYIRTITFIFFTSGILSLLLVKQKTLMKLVGLCIACSAAFLLTLTMGASYLNQNTAKPLVTTLKTIIQPQDEVIHYFKFYQDVPLYLGQQVTIVADWHSPEIVNRDNWVRELWYGMPFQKTEDWLITEAIFWQRWNNDKRVFVFLNDNYFEQFKQQATRYFVLGKYNDIILLSNKPTVS